MISEKELANYFKAACTKHKQLNHREGKPTFFRMNNRDVTTKLKNAGDIIFVMESPEFNLSDNTGDGIMKDKRGAFFIGKLVKTDDFDAQDEAADECEVLCEDIISLMRKDNRDYNAQLFGYLPIGQISGFKVGPAYGGYWGKRVEFVFGDSLSLKYNPDKWN